MIRAVSCKPSTPAELEALAWRLGYAPTRNFRGVTTELDGEIGAITGYDRWTTNSVHIHIWVADPRAVTRHSLRESIGFPFQTRNVLIGVIAADNAPSLEFCKRLGFRETYRIKDGDAIGVDLIIHELRKDEACRWLKAPRKAQ